MNNKQCCAYLFIGMNKTVNCCFDLKTLVTTWKQPLTDSLSMKHKAVDVERVYPETSCHDEADALNFVKLLYFHYVLCMPLFVRKLIVW